ncbi:MULTISPECIES: F0F1 ATP synthase subunit delta [Paenibacillus]|uniref:ATP synthase subunit delta n=1 Tax=Paenibacillus anseongense TaxID=2682845 RepID=A0ABW9U4Z3_9BACL|nr:MULTISPECIES: F0F1 ATP synthase subunit delta [Paenibacillus]MBA2942467.1 F0F1 ATP synthase subunit delta [Paenibacillus sp. CGMCC 1.16610]MVQ34541.1 F0F1 ATP synthase subunit delta [Paenibacillus anseongense]
MSDIVVAKRYARALFEVAKDKGIISQVEEELKSVASAIRDNADLQKFLNHPNIGNTVKTDLLKQIFEGKVSEPVWNTLLVLIDKGRQAILSVLVGDYVKIANEALGQASATIYSAFTLTEAQQAEIASHFSKVTGKTIRVATVVEPKLLGGIQVRIGDRLYDGSLAGKLDRLSKALV